MIKKVIITKTPSDKTWMILSIDILKKIQNILTTCLWEQGEPCKGSASLSINSAAAFKSAPTDMHALRNV